MDMKLITELVIKAYRCQPVSLKGLTPTERKVFTQMLKTKSVGALYNTQGREQRDNRQMLRNSSNGPAKIHGTW